MAREVAHRACSILGRITTHDRAGWLPAAQALMHTGTSSSAEGSSRTLKATHNLGSFPTTLQNSEFGWPVLANSISSRGGLRKFDHFHYRRISSSTTYRLAPSSKDSDTDTKREPEGVATALKDRAEQSNSAPVTAGALSPPAPPSAPPGLSVNTPQEAMKALVNVGLARGDRDNSDIMLSSIMGGAYLAVGGMMMITVAGGSPEIQALAPGLHSLLGASVFPIGLTLITLTGSDLLTSNMMFTALPFLTHPHRTESNMHTALKVNGLSLVGNFVGSVGMACVAASAIITAPAMKTFIAGVAVKKCSLPLVTAFTKAAVANWLVNLAVYNAATSNTTGGKVLGVWLPIMSFVTLGLEHSVANMFLIPLGMLHGADVTTAQLFLNNLVPVIAGNALGAAGFVSYVHWRMMLKGQTFK